VNAGVPVDVDRWHWSCGFYPGLHPGQHRYGTAANFAEALTGFEADWRSLSPEIPEGAFEEYRRERDHRAEIRAIHARGEKLPSETPVIADALRLRHHLRQPRSREHAASRAACLRREGRKARMVKAPKPLDLSPAAARAFIEDMQAYFAENRYKQDEIAVPHLHAPKQYQGPREKPLRLSDVKAMFRQMGDQL
jgi:hypothetical protein